MISKVDTFEQDIAEEIKRKDASLTEISAASNNIGNNPEDTIKKPVPVFMITLVSLFIFGMIGMLTFAYMYFTGTLLQPNVQEAPITEVLEKKPPSLISLSPTLNTAIGRYVTALDKKDAGYIITINAYAPVFSYMLRNENEYIEELASVVSPSTTTPKALTSVTPKVVATSSPSTKPTATSTGTTTPAKTPSTGTTTVIVATTSTTTPTIEERPRGPYVKDVTISNQNMRVWTSDDQVVVYAFITNDKIAIARTTEEILTLKNAIIR